jgi:hypothetical protein
MKKQEIDMSIFKVDPKVIGPKYGYRADQNPFVNSRTGYNLDSDLKRGFKTAVNNNQQRLALEYMSYIMDIIDDKFSDAPEQQAPEEQESTEASVAKSRKTTKGNSPQAPVSTEEESSE